MISIAMTAALRPEILVKTLKSICTLLQSDHELRLVIDVAPVGDSKYTQSDMIRIVDHFFPYPKHVARTLDDSMQAEALRWTWEVSCGEYSDFFLQWEDDWELMVPIYLDDIIRRIPARTGVLCFDRVGKSVLDYSGYKDHFEKYSSGLYRRIKGKSLGGPPAIVRSKYAQDVFPIMRNDVCLDVLSRTVPAQKVLSDWDVMVFTGSEVGGLVKDIGKAWRQERGLLMKKDTKRGVTWIQK